jgi:hypothetical protein
VGNRVERGFVVGSGFREGLTEGVTDGVTLIGLKAVYDGSRVVGKVLGKKLGDALDFEGISVDGIRVVGFVVGIKVKGEVGT